MNTKHIGEIAEIAIILSFLKKGWSVSKTIGENQRYDLIVDTGQTLLKVQCKSAKIKNGCICATISRVGTVNNKISKIKYKTTEIDGIALYCEELNKCYFIESKDLIQINGEIQTHISLRYLKTKNDQKSNVRWAETFQL